MTFRVRAMGPRFSERNLANASGDADMTFGLGSRNFFVDSPDAVGQAVYTRLLLWQGEWWLDLAEGMPWLQQVLGHPPSFAADLAIRQTILDTPYVTSLYDYVSAYDPTTRIFVVSGKITTAFGPITAAPAGAS